MDINQSITEKKFVIHLYPRSTSASGDSVKLEAEVSSIRKMIEIRTISDINVQIPISEVLNRNSPSDSSSSNFLHEMNVILNSKLTEEELFLKMLTIPIIRESVDNFETVLSNAVKKRVEYQLGLCKKCYSEKNMGHVDVTCNHASVGVLFSGGLDSIVIACLVDRYSIIYMVFIKNSLTLECYPFVSWTKPITNILDLPPLKQEMEYTTQYLYMALATTNTDIPSYQNISVHGIFRTIFVSQING